MAAKGLVVDEHKLHKYLDPVLDNPSVKKWNIFKLDPISSSSSSLFSSSASSASSYQIREPHEFRQSLKLALRPYFKSVVYTHFHDGALWAAIDLLSVGLKQAKTMIFLCHYPHAEFVFLSAFKNSAVVRFLHLALAQVFHCRALVQVNCRGSSLDALADLALFPLSQGSFGAYRLYKLMLDGSAGLVKSQREWDDRTRRNRMENAAGAGEGGSSRVALEHERERTHTTGALSREETARQTKATSALKEIRLVVDHDLRVHGGGEAIAFECKLVVKGQALMHNIKQLSGVRVISGEDASEHVADASNVIQGALNHSRARKRVKTTGQEEEEEELPEKGVRAIGVGLS